MRLLDPRRPSPARALAVAVAVTLALPLVPSAPLVSTARAGALAPTSPSYGDLMVEAGAKRDAGAHAEAAALLGQAYRARLEQERADEVGENTVRAAMLDYELATSSEAELAVLEAQAELLREFLDARRHGQEAARAKRARKVPEVPDDLVAQLERLDARIAELRAQQQAEAAAREEVEPAPVSEADPPSTEQSSRDRGRTRDGLLLGFGLASLVGGAGLIGGGAWNFVRITERGNARVAALDAEPRYTVEQRLTYSQALDDWRAQWRGISTALVASGVFLAAAGLGLTAWGIVRMRKRRSTVARAALAPAVGRRHLGLTLDVTF